MPVKPIPTAQVLTMLAEAPPRIAARTAGLTREQLHAAPAPGEWSVNDILAHLRACADVWGRTIATMLAQNTPTIRTISPRTWLQKTDYPEQEFHPALHAFTTQRGALLADLEALAPGDWSRAATMTGAGKPFTLTVHSYAQALAEHERPHIKQIERIAQTMLTA